MKGSVQFVLEHYPALTFPLFRRYWFASFASVGATQLITLGQGWLIFELTGSALQLGILGAAASVPNIVVTLFGGVIADRFDKRQILRLTSITITGLLAVLAWLDFTGAVQVWHVITIAGLVSLITGLDWPARVAIYPHLVERHAFMSAVALNSFIWQSTRMAIPAVGGVLMYYADTWFIFALGSAGFLVMFVVISGVHVHLPKAPAGSPWQQLVEGLRFIWHNDLFKWLIGLTFIGMFLAQSYSQLLPIFVDLMGMQEQGFGYLLSAGGLGAVLGTIIVGGLNSKENLAPYMFSGALISVLSLLMFVVAVSAAWVPLAFLSVFVAAICSSVFLIMSMTILQMRVPDELRGRVMGIHAIGFSLVQAGGLLLGAVAERTTPGTAVVMGNLIYLAALLVAWGFKPMLRRARNEAHAPSAG